MPAIAYREHLDLFTRYHRSSVSYTKVALSLMAALVLTFSLSFFLSTSQNKKVEPVNEQIAYFKSADSSYFKAKQSLEEVSANLKVAGVKTQKIDSLKEASPSAQVPGYFITLGDIQKMTQQIQSAKENIKSQREAIEKLSVPSIYETLDNQIRGYLTESEDLLVKMETTQVGLKDLVLASSPAFFLPTLSDEATWNTQDREKIKEFYLKKKADAQLANDAFTKIQTTPELKNYKDLQLSYFQLVINVCDNVVKVIERPIEDSFESQTQLIEESYQVLVGAQRENEMIAQKLLEERIKLTSSQQYFDLFSALNNRERLIESGLVQGSIEQKLNSQEFEKTNKSIIEKLDFSGFTN